MDVRFRESEEEETLAWWMRTEWESEPASREARRWAYWVLPAASELRIRAALAKAWCWAADSRSASRKCRVVKYESPPMLKESTSAPSTKMAVMRAPMPSPCQTG